MTESQLDQWVRELGVAWERLDTDMALCLVDKQRVEWSESPFSETLTTWQQVYDVWKKDLAKQENVTFSHQVIACTATQGVVRWQASFTRIENGKKAELDGIFIISLNDKNLCEKFMMWIESKD